MTQSQRILIIPSSVSEFSTRVISMVPEGDGWRLVSECNGQKQSRLFEGVLMANGTLNTPNIPSLPGTFAGRLMHSSEYRRPSVFKDKRVDRWLWQFWC